MIRVTFLYPNKPGSRFDAAYYIDVHMPLAIKRLQPALKGATAEIGISSDMPGQPAYAAIAVFLFESVEAFNTAVMPHHAELQGDIPNYTDIEPVVQISEQRLVV